MSRLINFLFQENQGKIIEKINFSLFTVVRVRCWQWTWTSWSISPMLLPNTELLWSERNINKKYLFNINFSRLKLKPDERRSQQSSAISGVGTIMVDQEFLFHVRNNYNLILLWSCQWRFRAQSWRTGFWVELFRLTKLDEERMFAGSTGISSERMWCTGLPWVILHHSTDQKFKLSECEGGSSLHVSLKNGSEKFSHDPQNLFML